MGRLSVAEVMDGEADASWLDEAVVAAWGSGRKRGEDGGPVLPYVRPGKTEWCHEKFGVVLPMPDNDLQEAMWGEVKRSHPEGDLGPACKTWLVAAHQWLASMVQRFQRGDGKITGNWAHAEAAWMDRLKRVRAGKELGELMQVIRHGGRLPFRTLPPVPIRLFRNHPNLSEKPVEVWTTVQEQLAIGAVVPYDVGEAVLVDGCRHVGGDLPWCMFSSRWVEKSGSKKVRVTCNGRPLKPFFAPESVACDLDTNDVLRHLWRESDLFVSFDQSQSFYHYMYWEGHRKYVGASFSCSELPAGIGQRLANRHPAAVLPEWNSKWGPSPMGQDLVAWKAKAVASGKFRIVVTYAGMMMGVSPSVAMLSAIMKPLIESWLLCTVGEGDRVQRPRGGNYVDDSIFAVAGLSFRNGLELSLRLGLEYVMLGFVLNLKPGKSSLVPLPHQPFLGLLLDVRRGCWFSLLEKRVQKLMAALLDLRQVARVGYVVPVILVARVVGIIWSIHAVAHRAVSIMCRGMIRILAVHLGRPELCEERNMNRLRVLLRIAWRGSGTWTAVSEGELNFWASTDLRALRSRMRHDAVRGDLRSWVARPDGSMAADVRVFAVDSSDSGSGGGEFIREGALWRMVPGTTVYVRLRDDEVGKSSAFRECMGVDRLDLAVIPKRTSRAIVVCDAQAAVAVLTRGSSIPELNEVAVRVFKRQLRMRRILFFCWASRDDHIIQVCDDRSRLTDNHAFQTAPAVFWTANKLAQQVFGQDFQVDAFADVHNVMPPAGSQKLPHFSRWWGPHSSGLDALTQDWTGVVSWVNPPFALLERVICLLRDQGAAAAVVVPRRSKARWSSWASEGAEGVVRIWDFDPRRPEFAMVGCTAPQKYGSGYAVVFFDFRHGKARTLPWANLPGARELRLRSEIEAAKRALGHSGPPDTTWAQLGVKAGSGGVTQVDD